MFSEVLTLSAFKPSQQERRFNTKAVPFQIGHTAVCLCTALFENVGRIFGVNDLIRRDKEVLK